MVSGVKGKVISLFKTITPKDYSKPKHVSHVYGRGKKPRKSKMKKQSKDNIIKDVKKFLD